MLLAILCSDVICLTLGTLHIVLPQALTRYSSHEDTMNRLNSKMQRLEELEKQRQEEEKYLTRI